MLMFSVRSALLVSSYVNNLYKLILGPVQRIGLIYVYGLKIRRPDLGGYICRCTHVGVAARSSSQRPKALHWSSRLMQYAHTSPLGSAKSTAEHCICQDFAAPLAAVLSLGRL